MIKCTNPRDKRGWSSITLKRRAYKIPRCRPGDLEENLGPLNPDDLNAVTEGLIRIGSPSVVRVDFLCISQKQRPSKSIKHVCV